MVPGHTAAGFPLFPGRGAESKRTFTGAPHNRAIIGQVVFNHNLDREAGRGVDASGDDGLFSGMAGAPSWEPGEGGIIREIYTARLPDGSMLEPQAPKLPVESEPYIKKLLPNKTGIVGHRHPGQSKDTAEGRSTKRRFPGAPQCRVVIDTEVFNTDLDGSDEQHHNPFEEELADAAGMLTSKFHATKCSFQSKKKVPSPMSFSTIDSEVFGRDLDNSGSDPYADLALYEGCAGHDAQSLELQALSAVHRAPGMKVGVRRTSKSQADKLGDPGWWTGEWSGKQKEAQLGQFTRNDMPHRVDAEVLRTLMADAHKSSRRSSSSSARPRRHRSQHGHHSRSGQRSLQGSIGSQTSSRRSRSAPSSTSSRSRSSSRHSRSTGHHRNRGHSHSGRRH